MLKYLKPLLVVIIIYFFSAYLYENWNKISEIRYETNWLYCSLSAMSLLATLFLLPISFRHVVALFNYDIPLKKISIILFCSQFAKYLPGGIWGYVGRIYLYRKEGMSVLDASKSVFLETLLVLLSGLFVSLCCLCFFDSYLMPKYINSSYLRVAGIFVLIILLIVMHPNVLNRFLKIVPERFKKEDLWFDYHYGSLVKPSLYLIAFWLGIGVGFWLLIKSFIHIEPSLFPVTTGAFVLSWLIGIVIFFVPAGLGARELSLVALLNMCMPAYISAFIAVAARIWWVVGELIWFIISFVWDGSAANKDKIIKR